MQESQRAFKDALYLHSRSEFSSKKALFTSPAPAGRRITAGFSYIQRIGKSAAIDVWFPEALHRSVNRVLAEGKTPGIDAFPAEWAAVRQFELLQDAGNYKIYDLDPTRLMRTLRDFTRNMRGGGYRITIATIGSYTENRVSDDLEILDQRLQKRISNFINMMYLEEQSERINAGLAKVLRHEKWDFQTALPHVGCTLGARDLFRPSLSSGDIVNVKEEKALIPFHPHGLNVEFAKNFVRDGGVIDAFLRKPMQRVEVHPAKSEYAVINGHYQFANADHGKDVLISYAYRQGSVKPSAEARRHRLSRHFFDILGLLPQKHIRHETAIGLQLPEQINEHEWVYIAPDGEKVGDLVRLLDNLFAPFNGLSLSELHGREDGRPEIKATVGHMQGYGDRLNEEADLFYSNLARSTDTVPAL